MLTPLKKAALAGVVAATTLTALAAGARADSLTFSFGDDGPSLSDYRRPPPPPPGWDRGPPPPPGWDRGPPRPEGWDRGDWRRDRWSRPGWDRACTPDRAVEKAYRMGVNRPRVVDMDRRTIDVAGWQDGDRVRLTFARAPRCPVLD